MDNKDDKEYTSWIVSHDGTSKTPYRMECLRCGAIKDVETPIDVSKYVVMAELFVDKHKYCEEEHIGDIILGIGNSAYRTLKFTEALPDGDFLNKMLKKEARIYKKYEAKILNRFDEFCEFVRKHNSGKVLADEYIKEHIPELCSVLKILHDQKVEEIKKKQFINSKIGLCPSCGEASPDYEIKMCKCGKVFCYECGYGDMCHQCFHETIV